MLHHMQVRPGIIISRPGCSCNYKPII
jgi:hypothetical protein